MEGNSIGVKRINYMNIILSLLIILILLLNGSMNFIESKKRILTVNAASIWSQTEYLNFDNCIKDNISISSNDELKLDLETNFVEDDFFNEFYIDFKKNVEINSSAGNAKLNKFFKPRDEQWNKTFGGSKEDKGYSVEQTTDGGYIIAGQTYSYGLFVDVWLIKTNKNGNEQWNRTFGGSKNDEAYSVQQTSDGGYIITGYYGKSSRDLYLIKTNKSGILQWEKIIGGDQPDVGHSVQQTKDGGYIIGGITCSYGTGNPNMWLVKTDSFGNEQWNRSFGGFLSEKGYSVLQTSDGGYIIIGKLTNAGNGFDIWLIKTNNTGIKQWEKWYGGTKWESGFSIQNTSDGGYIIVGQTESYGEGKYDVWLVKINKNGIIQWDKTFGSTKDDLGKSVQQTFDGGYIITGWTESKANDYDLYLIKTDNLGNSQWNRTFGGSKGDWGETVQQTSDGGYIIVGYTNSYGAGDYDLWLIKTDSLGKYYPNGSIISKNLLQNTNTYSINRFNYTTDLSLKTNIKIQFSQNKIDWYDSYGTLNGWDTLKNGSYSIDLEKLNWSGSDFYYKAIFSAEINSINSPSLQNINLSFDKYYSKGHLESHPVEIKNRIVWKYINYTATIPKETEIKFQVKTAKMQSALISKDFVGPDGSINSFFTSPNELIWTGHKNEQWFQYKIYLFTENSSLTPILKDFIINFNILPSTPLLITPKNNSCININRPTFKWIFIDNDSEFQKGFHWQLDDEIKFNTIILDLMELYSSDPFHKPKMNISDGIWFWRVKTQDSDGDWSEFSEPWKIIIDSKAPKSTISAPINNGFYNDLNMISGTAFDLKIGTGLNKIEIRIENLENNFNWNGNKWVNKEVWLVVNGTSEWYYNSSSIKWTSGMRYCLKSKAYDNANNIEIPKNGIKFSIDMDNPISKIEFPINYSFLNNLDNITGSSKDFGGSNVSKVEICIQHTKNKYFWNGSNWDSNEYWLPTIGINKWFYDASKVLWISDIYYTIYSKAIDYVGNQENPKTGIIFMFDNKPPELSILINENNNYTKFTSVVLDLFANDTGSGISQMRLSKNNIDWTNWTNFYSNIQFIIPDGDGVKNVYFEVKDKANNTVFKKDDIILDTTPPYSLSMLINDGEKQTNSTSVNLKLFALDNLSGISEMSFSYNSKNWSQWEKYSEFKKYYLLNEKGNNTIYFKVKDRAGNIANPISETIFINTTNPELDRDLDINQHEKSFEIIYWLIVIIIVIILIIFVLSILIFKHNRKTNINLKQNNSKK
jgi:hypothetical protein